MFESLKQDVTFAMRSLGKSPGLAMGIILTLALGLGVNMAMFSFLDVVFLRPPRGVEQPDEIRRVWREVKFRSGTQYWPGFDYQSYAAMQRALGDRVETASYTWPRVMRIGEPGVDASAKFSYVTASFFPMLGVRPFAGRFFSAGEDKLGDIREVAVASHAYWQSALGGDRAAIGRTILIGSRRYTLIGVAEEGFSGVELDAVDLFLPMSSQLTGTSTPWWQNRNVNGFQVLLRPMPGGPTHDAALAQRITLGLSAPDADGRRAEGDSIVVALGSVIRAQGPGTKEQEVRIATRLAGVTTVVLIIACANVVNLLLARALRRRREIAVRLALGMSRVRLARLLMTESVLLSLAAAAGAVLAAFWGGELLRTLMMPTVTFAEGASPLHWRVIALATVVGIGAGLVAGVLPAVQSAKTDLTNALKAGSGSSGGHAPSSRVRAGLVVAQAALSVVLLVGAGLFVASLSNVRSLRIGYDVPHVVFAGVSYDTRDSARDARLGRDLGDLAERLRGRSGIETVALASIAPTRGFGFIEWLPDVDTAQYKRPLATYNVVSPEFFEAVGMRLVRGGGFPRIAGGAMPPVVVVNDQMAKAQWPGMEPIGRCMRFPPDGDCYRVVGVVETAMFDKLIETPEAFFYLPIERLPSKAMKWVGTMVVRAEPGARDAIVATLRQEILDAFPGSRPAINTLESYMEPRYRPWRLGATLFTAFGVLALIVAALGIYSTVSYTVAQRTHEFGVRAALGARAHDILAHVLRDSMRTVTVGVLAGIALAIAAGRFVASLLYGVEPGDPAIMVGVAVTLLVIAAGAALGPAWRAARVDPMIALRSE